MYLHARFKISSPISLSDNALRDFWGLTQNCRRTSDTISRNLSDGSKRITVA
jgi:hypothetical protein